MSVGQPTDPVALQATVQRRACQVWDHVLQRDEHVVERQSRLHRTPDVFEVLERGCAQVGYPASIRADNGSEFYLPRARSVGLHEGRRSEEHTSELQSLMRISNAVFVLKTKNTI